MTKRHFGRGACSLFTCALLMMPLAASAQTSSLSTQIREVSFDSSGHTNIIVSVAGPALAASQTLTSSNFSVTENGNTVPGLTSQSLSAAKTFAVSLVLAMDVSSSMSVGGKLDAAKAAAHSFIASLPTNVGVALVAFGSDVRVVQDFTTDHAVLDNGINGLAIAGRTALFDALVQGSNLLTRRLNAQHNIVLFTDGYEGDNNSKATLADAVSSLKASNTAATTVLLGTPGKGFTILQQVVAAVKGGQSLQASDTSALGTAFARAAQGLTSQYLLSYPGTDFNTKDLNIAVTASLAGFTATDQSVVLNTRDQVQNRLTPLKPATPWVHAFGGNLGLYLGIAAAFVGILFFVGMLLYAPAGAVEERALQRRLRLYTRGGDRKKKKETTGGILSGSAVGRGAVSLVERLPRPSGLDERLQIELDRAGWPIRASEFIIIQVGGFVGGILIGWALLQRVYLGLALAVVGAVVPRLLLNTQIARRTATFLSQLPDTLQLLSGSLQAGYGFMQALDTVAKEAVAPTSTEFARVLSEARLGRPIDEALDSMAERVGGEDFKWVVLAINIQRQVGGNLAQLLTTVANTLREREQVRRQIKVLSAEGRLSAYILVALPFVLFGYLSVINPNYIHQLTHETIGKLMMLGALILIGVGAVWMRKVVNIDV